MIFSNITFESSKSLSISSQLNVVANHLITGVGENRNPIELN
jgi:hypothetical protein